MGRPTPPDTISGLRDPDRVTLVYPLRLLTPMVGLNVVAGVHNTGIRGSEVRAAVIKLLLAHQGRVLQQQAVLSYVTTCPVGPYMHATRRVLEASDYFKRLAVSVLKVDATDEAGE